MRNPAQVAIPVVVPRAVVVWGVTRLMLAALPMAIGEPFGSVSPSPVAVVFFAGIVGLIDVAIRGEQLLWANLSVKPGILYALYSSAAIPAEIVLALALP
jgi:hypothetical protein